MMITRKVQVPIVLGNSLVSWVSCNQKVVSRSSTESKYRTIASVLIESIFLKSLLHKLLVLYDRQFVVFCDNLSTQQLVENHVMHAQFGDSTRDGCALCIH